MLPTPRSIQKSSPILGRGFANWRGALESDSFNPKQSFASVALQGSEKSATRVPFNGAHQAIADNCWQLIEKSNSKPEAIQLTIHLGENPEPQIEKNQESTTERMDPASEPQMDVPKLSPHVPFRGPSFEPFPSDSAVDQPDSASPMDSPSGWFPNSSDATNLWAKFTSLNQITKYAAALVFLGFSILGFLVGKLTTGSQTEENPVNLSKPTPGVLQDISDALALATAGQPADALLKLQALANKNSEIPSLDYLIALTAMQSGDLKTAQERATMSLQKKQKVSDALVLLSLTESAGAGAGKASLRDPRLVRESLLRQAVESDVANPFPMIELASFLRAQKRDAEALDLLKAANDRLHPIDTHVVVATSIQLLHLQQTPDDKLPAVVNDGSIPEIFASIYISLRKKDYKQAAVALEKGRHQASPDLFSYLINDPAFKPFRSEPVLSQVL